MGLGSYSALILPDPVNCISGSLTVDLTGDSLRDFFPAALQIGHCAKTLPARDRHTQLWRDRAKRTHKTERFHIGISRPVCVSVRPSPPYALDETVMNRFLQ